MSSIRTATVVAFLATALFATAAHAQRGGRGSPPLDGALALGLYPPELVMRQQSELGLRPEQRETLIAELQAAQADLVPLQFEVQEAEGKLRELLAGARVDEAEVLSQGKRVMGLEADVRARHLTLLVRIKNLLDEGQQALLDSLIQERREQRRGARSSRQRGGRRP